MDLVVSSKSDLVCNGEGLAKLRGYNNVVAVSAAEVDTPVEGPKSSAGSKSEGRVAGAGGYNAEVSRAGVDPEGHNRGVAVR